MVRINLLPVRVSKKKEAGKQQIVLFVLVLVLGIILNFWWSQSRTADLKAREASLAKTRAEIAQLDRIIGEVKNIRDAQKSLQEKLDVLDKLKAGRSGPVRMLDELATITPKRLWLRKVEEKKGGATTFDGSAASIDDVSVFMTALKGSKYFSGIVLKKTAAAATKEFRFVDFTITASANYSPASQDAAGSPGGAPGAAPRPKGG